MSDTHELESEQRLGRRDRMAVQRREGGAPGKRTRVDNVRETARAGVSGGGGALPHAEQIQRSFGRHDISGVRAHVGGAAGSAAEAIGAEAYATGSNVAFRGAPDLHTAAHEAAHVVQQKTGLALAGGVGTAGDAHEQHADAVADRVVAGASAEDLLDQYAREPQGEPAPSGHASDVVQNKCAKCDADKDDQSDQSDDEPLQMSLLDGISSALDHAAEAGAKIIDLLGPKLDLKRKISDVGWIVDLVQAAQKNDAHPRHKVQLFAELASAGFGVGMEALELGKRIASCTDLAAVQDLEQEFEAWKTVRAAAFPTELLLIIETYRQTEREWVQEFIDHGPLVRDPAFPNKKGKPVELTFTPGNPTSEVAVESRVKLNFALTPTAAAEGLPALTEADERQFEADFQTQLDMIWTTATGAIPPFRLAGPGDHLLANEGTKWSDFTATLKAKVEPDDSDPHFTVDVLQPGTHEPNRASVGDRTATFYMPDAVVPTTPGVQPTLAHEWHHMIGNPDEYAENNEDELGEHVACMAHFLGVIGRGEQAERDQAVEDMGDVIHQYDDGDAVTPGKQRRIFDLQNRPDIPDVCFAERAGGQRLRPGAQSQRGGLHISKTAADVARLSHGGTEVRPYMREGIVEELKSLLAGAFSAGVTFDHNFKDMSRATHEETLKVRIQNKARDLALGVTSATESAPEAAGEHDHDHAH